MSPPLLVFFVDNGLLAIESILKFATPTVFKKLGNLSDGAHPIVFVYTKQKCQLLNSAGMVIKFSGVLPRPTFA